FCCHADGLLIRYILTATHPMTPERWRRIESIWLAARELAISSRASFLTEACEGDEALRQEVESLLSHQESAEAFLDAPAIAVAARMAGSSSLIGCDIGFYQVEAQLGTGGMGEVYRARARKLHRLAAIKVLADVVAAAAAR